MMRRPIFALILMTFLYPFLGGVATCSGQIITEAAAKQHGLVRPWFTQLELVGGLSRLAYITLDRGTLFLQTDQAILHAIDAETGKSLWKTKVGSRQHPSLHPGASSMFVSVINGSTLYVLNRKNGKRLWQMQIDGAPGAGPAMNNHRVFVPLSQGAVLAYSVEQKADQKRKRIPGRKEEAVTIVAPSESVRIKQEWIPPMFCPSVGLVNTQPLVVGEDDTVSHIAWVSDRGMLFAGKISKRYDNVFQVDYRLTTRDQIVSRPTYMLPDPKLLGDSGILFIASRDGSIHAIQERKGRELWVFRTGESNMEPAVVIGHRIYQATQLGGLYCIDVKTGREIWWAPNVKRFVAASKDRVYVSDTLGNILVLDAKTGTRLDTLPTAKYAWRLLNMQTDRIYLATKRGLIQCLHEVELTKPLEHRKQEQVATEKKPAAKSE